jgi:hypothetical protein
VRATSPSAEARDAEVDADAVLGPDEAGAERLARIADPYGATLRRAPDFVNNAECVGFRHAQTMTRGT